ncbi:hypothetical protein L1887_54169 [Cichorium endivia]|nr:hypothetical protein L1887_62713 [Cichorium endivia]KAI3476454.1 hypothetical protein L1887_61971 [Cichorium endivia]KAI3477734.1 hypothetical protein L1887_60481 [Cichorium endivia]KAI3478106.1 hypothetical protein L1887_60002 [Cichorium endivia]KAI3481387.1 hypothetical protein L1887_56325 [Cichorium endivia]
MKGHLALYARQPVPLPTTCSRARIEICDSSSPVRSIKGALARWVTDVDGTGSASKDALRYMILSIHSLMGFYFNLFAILVPAENASFCPNAYAFRCMLELLFLTTCLRTAAS